jgi:hypothetical protein
VAAATFFRGQAAVKQSFPGAATVNEQGQSWSQQGSQQAPPQFAQQQAAPAVEGGGAKQCIHGAMTFREGVGKASGKPYKAWFCSAPRGDNQCAPEFVR